VSRFVSGTGTVLYLGTGVVLPLLIDGKNGGQHSLRTLDSLGTSVLLCQSHFTRNSLESSQHYAITSLDRYTYKQIQQRIKNKLFWHPGSGKLNRLINIE